MIPLYLSVCVFAGNAAEDWWTPAALRRFISPEGAKTVGYWRGESGAALAAHDGKNVFAVVALDDKSRVLWDGEVRVAGGRHRPLTSLDLEGVVLRNWAILFHTEPRLARSALSFDTGDHNGNRMKFVLVGLAAGTWEVWRNGWLIDSGAVVREREGVLYFEERPGSYFLRRLN